MTTPAATPASAAGLARALSAGSGDPLLARLLADHPELAGRPPLATDRPGILFGRGVDAGVGDGGLPRYVGPDISGGDARGWDGLGSDARGGEGRSGPGVPFGLIEHMDNNPLVCADLARTPNPAQTLALVALGPLLKTGLILEPPVLVLDVETDEGELLEALRTEDPGFEGVTLSVEAPVHPTVRRLHAIVAVRDPRPAPGHLPTPTDFEEFDEMFAERYGRALYVRRNEGEGWSPENVADRPWAEYRLRIGPGEDGASLLTVTVMADLRGKLGACGTLHAMNVMANLEESLGIPERLPELLPAV